MHQGSWSLLRTPLMPTLIKESGLSEGCCSTLVVGFAIHPATGEVQAVTWQKSCEHDAEACGKAACNWSDKQLTKHNRLKCTL